MTIKRVLPLTPTARAVKELYYEAFPENERLPYGRMLLLGLLKPSVSLLAYYQEGGALCGFTFTVNMKSFLYINYIAVAPEMRCHRCGEKILGFLQSAWPMAQLCDAKVPEQNTDDYQIDLRRISFWERNGFDFFKNQHTITNPQDVTYYICGKDMEFQRENYFSIFDHLSFGPGALFRTLRNRM